MKRIAVNLHILTAVVGGWAIANGILHDAFVIVQERPYDRNTLRLFMDGHILITCGLVQLLAFGGLKKQETRGYYIAGLGCLSLLIYCILIFPFLKSYGIILINTFLLVSLIYSFILFKSRL